MDKALVEAEIANKLGFTSPQQAVDVHGDQVFQLLVAGGMLVEEVADLKRAVEDLHEEIKLMKKPPPVKSQATT